MKNLGNLGSSLMHNPDRRDLPLTTSPRFLNELEEALGILEEVQEKDGFIMAKFRTFAILLPLEIGPRLLDLIGRRVGILKLEGYHVRCLDAEDVHA